LSKVDDELRELAERLIPLAKGRVIHSSRLSPETFAEELGALASLYVIRENLSG